MKIIPERASHWYHRDGTACHQVQAKSGKGLRDTTLRDARELGLFPSTTSILKVINKPELENWKQTQAILAALTLPRKREEFEEWYRRTSANLSLSVPLGAPPNEMQRMLAKIAYENPPRFVEDEQAFAARVVEDSQAQASDAADFGRRIHKAVEARLLNVASVADPEIEPYLESVEDWIYKEVEHVYAAESVVVNYNWGYAGTFDLHCRLLRGIGEAVVDFKTQAVKNGKPAFYFEWAAQLAAYSRAIWKSGNTVPDIISIVIDSQHPGPVFVKQWTEHEQHWAAFLAARTLWCWQKNYDPTLNPNTPCPP